MDPFVAWNLRLLEAFFSPASKGEEVWLSVDPEELDALGPDIGGDEGFLEAVRSGPPWPTIPGGRGSYVDRGTPALLTQRVKGLVRQRMQSLVRPSDYVDPGEIAGDYAGRDAPPYLPILAALIRCCAAQDDSGYYADLRKSLHLPDTWYSQDMAEIEDAWRDLARWSGANGAQFGRFEFRQLGGYRYIGVPRSQSIVSRRDVTALTRVFAQVGVRAGQRPTDSLIEDVRRHAADSSFLSIPFRKALADARFLTPVRERLRALLEEWDGVVVGGRADSETGGGSGVHNCEGDAEELGVALGLGPGNVPPWQVRWRIPAIRDAGTVHLKLGSDRWSAAFMGTETTTTAPVGGGVEQSLACDVLTRSADEDIVFDATLGGDESFPGSPLGKLVLRRKILRSFVGAREVGSPDDRFILHERPVPANGTAYLLAPPANTTRLRTYLERHHTPFEGVTADGLPPDWLLVHVSDCSRLGDASDNDFPDGESVRSQPRVIRLVGGRSVQRAGIRQYLAYDLPYVELDAPRGAVIRADGLELNEREEVIQSRQDRGGVIGGASGLRRFDIRVVASGGRAFTIEAVIKGEVIGAARLRLASSSGLGTEAGDKFSLDRQGNPLPNTSGLIGALVGTPDWVPIDVEEDLRSLVGVPCTAEAVRSIVSSTAGCFLDSLARAGAMAYGVARDQLRRLTERESAHDATEPTAILRELRSRGMLEIEHDSKGRWIRVHAVKPCLCVLPVRMPSGFLVAALSGSPLQQHWKTFCEWREHGAMAYAADDDGTTVLRSIRIAIRNAEVMTDLAKALGLEVAFGAPLRIARWASSVSDVRDEMEAVGVESLGTTARGVERYVPAMGLFRPSANGAAIEAEFEFQLFRLEDAETGRHQLYMLGFHDAEKRPRYTFVRDSRWGVWIALAAFADFAELKYSIADAKPWPLHYERRNRTLWLPARLNLPVVLERALMLCSGAKPIEARVCGVVSERGRIELSQLESARPIGTASLVYEQFAPKHPRWATWLGYRWVPEVVARSVADKLGAALHDLLPTASQL